MEEIKVLGINIDRVTRIQALAYVRRLLSQPGKHYIVTPYAIFTIWAERDPEFRRALNCADLAIPDGIGLVAAAKFMTMPVSDNRIARMFQVLGQGLWIGWQVLFAQNKLDTIPERVSGVDFMVDLSKMAATEGRRIFLLGGWGNSAKQVSSWLKSKWPGLCIDYSAGVVDARVETGEAFLKIKKQINAFRPDFLFVAYGAVKQEKWIMKHLDELEVQVVMGVGSSFDILAGQLSRAPELLRKHGLEWFWKLVMQPWRLPRIWATFPVFPLRIAWEKWQYGTIQL